MPYVGVNAQDILLYQSLKKPGAVDSIKAVSAKSYCYLFYYIAGFIYIKNNSIKHSKKLSTVFLLKTEETLV